jgi:hypothetical protein
VPADGGHDALDGGQNGVEGCTTAVFERDKDFCCLLSTTTFGTD